MVRGGNNNEIVDVMKSKSVVAFGRAETGDCTDLATRDHFRARLHRADQLYKPDQLYLFACDLWTHEPLTDWDINDLLDAGLVTQDELETLPDPEPTMDPRTYWTYIGTRWDVTLDGEGQPLLVPADVEGLDADDPTAELRRRLEVHLRPPYEPLSKADVQAMAALGVAPESDFENRGGGCMWHHSIPEE